MKIAISLAVASLLLVAVSQDASAANFAGKFDVESSDFSSNNGTVRFYSASQSLSIFAAPGAYASMLQEAFFRKTFVNASYTPVACPAGITGSCGTLNTLTIAASNIP
jgi:hypothetical protein